MASNNVDQHSVQIENTFLRLETLSSWLLATLLCAWCWAMYVLAQNAYDVLESLSIILVFASIVPAYLLGTRRYHLACWLIISSAIIALRLVLAHDSSSFALVLAVLPIITANSLLGTRAGVVTVILAWLSSSTVLIDEITIGALLSAPSARILLFYALVEGGIWLAMRPLYASMESAAVACESAHQAVMAGRARRSELNRVIRALEDATYRLQRTNNQLVLAQREADEARAQKSHFAAVVSHEIRGPLNLILGFSRLIARFPERYAEPLPLCYHEDVETICRNSLHLSALVDDVLDLSQIETHKLPLSMDPVDMRRDVLEEMVDSVRPLAERKGLSLSLRCEENLPPLPGDAVRLRQALLNLLTNAIRFTEKGGIEVSAARQRDRVRVSVQDTGPGIERQYLDDLFKEFSQVPSHRDGMGSGLGLSICKHLVELHGGSIGVESAPGMGTTFSFYLPLTLSKHPDPQLIKTARISGPAADRTCIVVHEDQAVIRLLGRYLHGYRMVGVSNEEEAIELGQREPPCAFLTGLAKEERLIRWITKTESSVPVVTCCLPHVCRDGETANVIDHVAKPVTPETIGPIMARIPTENEATILLVDDEPDAVRLMVGMLDALPRPYRILTAHDGHTALALMKRQQPDIAFIDLTMPGLSGIELIAQMRQDADLQNVPVIIVSAASWLDDEALLALPLSVWARDPLPLAKGARCLQALLDALSLV